MLYTEFVSSGGLVADAEECHRKLDMYEEERPVGIQIFGGDVEQVRQAVSIVDGACPDLIDVNFGCPVRKVVCRDGGAGILRNLPKMLRITEAVIEQASRPVTVKTRLGWNDDTIRILEVARMLEGAGICALAVHARTRSQMYRGNARWEWLRRIREEGVRSIPLIGNGDATDPEKIKAMFDETGVDAVMIGRGAIGKPWIFREAKAFLGTGEMMDPPCWEERLLVVAEHLDLKCEWLGERKGVLEMRRQYGGYFSGFRNAGRLRALLMEQETRQGVLEVLLNFREHEAEIRIPVASLSSFRKVKGVKPAKLAVQRALPTGF